MLLMGQGAVEEDEAHGILNSCSSEGQHSQGSPSTEPIFTNSLRAWGESGACSKERKEGNPDSIQ